MWWEKMVEECQTEPQTVGSFSNFIQNIDLANTQRFYQDGELFHSQNLILDISRESPESGQGKR
jgi:hypothetical protein